MLLNVTFFTRQLNQIQQSYFVRMQTGKPSMNELLASVPSQQKMTQLPLQYLMPRKFISHQNFEHHKPHFQIAKDKLAQL